MKFILASNNKNKLVEMRDILSKMGVEVISQKEAGLDLEVEETGTTFGENAFLKAEAACRMSGMPSISDDSGLMVDALGGEPGVYSARYGGPGLDDVGRYELLLKNMEKTEQREGKYVSSIACVFPNGDVISAEGECEGLVLRAPKGDGGFGYDPVFYMPVYGRTMAEITPEEKNAVSHRGNALRSFEIKLKEYLEEHDTQRG